MVTVSLKNIAIVSNTSWSLYNFRKGLIQHFIDAGYTVFAVAPRDKFVAEIEQLGCAFIELQHINNKGTNPLEDLLLARELRQIFRTKGIGYCFLFTPKINIFGSMAAKFTSTKVVVTINGLGHVFTDGQPRWLQYTVKRLYALAFKNLEAIFFQNNDDKDYFLDFNLIQLHHKIRVVKGSGANLTTFDQKYDFNKNNQLVFVLSARLIHEKGLYEYFEAAKLLKAKFPNVTFALLGLEANNPSAIPLSVIEDMHDKKIIDYWGATDDMSEMLNKVDVVVLPSYYKEGIPKILIEAMAKGLPLITTQNVGCKETVEEGKNGFLIPVKDAAALHKAMEKMIRMSTEQLSAMGANSREKAELEFDEKYHHEAYLSILN